MSKSWSLRTHCCFIMVLSLDQSNSQPKFNEPISLNEMILALKKLKGEAACGPDLIHNLMLKNLPINSLNEIIDLFNLSLREGTVPKAWKGATITMIPKKYSPTQDPSNNRPISITSCLGKLLERIIFSRLYDFLEKNSLLIQEQSGFRKYRRTADNLVFLIQKVVESFNRKKKVCCLFFDISKAFDKVWHEGIINKLIKINIPACLINWIKSYLSCRTFKVNINDHISDEFNISACVPQGSVISPLLFSIVINDIPKRNKSNNEYSQQRDKI